jgi:RNA polymerase sigma-70 factor (ECF subfamily)
MSVADPATDTDLLAAMPLDVSAFEAFYDRYFERVTAFAARRCSNAEDVADVVAQTFIHLLGAAERYDPTRAPPAAFVLGIAANVVRDLHRSSARRRALVAKLAGRDLLGDDDIERIETAIDAARTARTLRGPLAAVPAGEREVLRLVAAGRTPGQAAAELGISTGAAWTRLSRARRRLRRVATDPVTGEAR